MRLPALSRLACATLILPLSAAAWADEAPPTDAHGRTVVFAAETVVDFEGLDVTGELVKPVGTMVKERRRAEFAPMIRLRADFNDELADSVDMVK
jgi:hypothetical protein